MRNWGFFGLLFGLLLNLGVLGQMPPDSSARTVEVSAVQIIVQLTAEEVQQMSTTAGTVIFSEEIQQKSPEDLGELTSKFSGVFVRSYGGAGGLKTLNARGLGSQHFLLVSNYQTLLFNQMGSANLGEIQTDGLHAVFYSIGGSDSWELPALAKTYSGVLHLKFLEMNTSSKDFLQIQTLGGSFGRYKLSGSWLKSFRNIRVFAQSYAYRFHGNYPFDYAHGLVQVQGQRMHNFTREVASRMGASWLLNKNHRLQGAANFLDAFRELPGAIVFYHPDNFQTLDNRQWNVQLRHEYVANKLQWFNFVNFSRTTTDYRDSFHLVAPQWQQYREDNWDVGHNGRWWFRGFKLLWSAQYVHSQLATNRADAIFPKRNRAIANMGWHYLKNNLKLRLDLPFQWLNDWTHGEKSQERFIFTPSLGLNKRWMGKQVEQVFRASVGQFARVATFSEMYYGAIGNPYLRPELSRMANTGWHVSGFLKQFEMNIGLDAFYGRIHDKIIAIPTQNLFVWSVRNLQEVQSMGFDASIGMRYTSKKDDWMIAMNHKSGFNHAIDVSDKNSPTYGHQIPYTPYWLHQTELSASWMGLALNYTYGFHDFRFVLGENIAANVLDAFQLHDLRLNYSLPNKQHKPQVWRIHVRLNNIFDAQYQVVRGFPMPGRNFEFGLTWRHN